MKKLRKNFSNIPGWGTKRKIVVIESDDWGSVRTRSTVDYNSMLGKGLNVDENFFTKYDALESNRDLENLFNHLTDFKDCTGRHPVFTPMCIVANPDFEKIKYSGFSQYSYKTLAETAEDYPNHNKLIDYWRKGVEERLFVPALHGREHLNVRRYLKGLQDDSNCGLKVSLEHGSLGASRWQSKSIIEYLGAFYPTENKDIEELKLIMQDAIRLFVEVSGYEPTHFIGPNREPAKELDKTLAEGGVTYITQSKLRKYPKGDDKFGFEFNWWGRRNKHDQIYIMRNCSFEPSGKPNSVNSCLYDIENAFKWNKPAVISSHRVNYVGSIVAKNSEDGLSQLSDLLNQILRKWPDVEFLTSTELGNSIRKSKGNA